MLLGHLHYEYSVLFFYNITKVDWIIELDLRYLVL